MTTQMRAGLTGAFLLSLTALAPAIAQAAPTSTFLTSVKALDVSADGRYVLLVDGTVIDRTTGTTSEPVPGTPVDLASASSKVLYALGGHLYVRDAFAAGEGTLVSVSGGGAPVDAYRGALVRNGATVVFSATSSSAPDAVGEVRKIEVGAVRSSVRITGVRLGRVSEDARVISFSKPLPTLKRPEGLGLPMPGLRTSFDGDAVGYLVEGDVPRLVGVPKVVERTGGPNGAITCATNAALYKISTPFFTLAQDGLAGGRYLLATGSREFDSNYPEGDRTAYTTGYQDPFSGASTSIFTTHGGAPLVNSVRVINEAGIGTPFGFPTTAPAPTTPNSGYYPDEVGFTQDAYAFGRGAGAVFVGAPRSKPITGTYVVEGLPTGGADVTPWQTLPRAEDPAFTGDEQIDATWTPCKDPVPPTVSSYATITASATGNSAGTVTPKATPVGRPWATSISATVSWYGIRTWSRTTTLTGPLSAAGEPIVLPSIPAGLPGFKVAVKVSLIDRTVITTSVPLRRTR